MSAEDDADDLIAEIKKLMEEDERKEQPDYRNTVYCDVHRGVKMVLALSWGSIQYGETSVDVNPNNLWVCPKQGCDRHYEPRMFGYHINEPGHRLGPETAKQPRCNHRGRPFMYIGKDGNGRRYECPLYKCDKHGAVVAEGVEDEEIELPPDPPANLKSAEKKRAAEMQVFQSFACASGLPIDPRSAENHEPDHPDILCKISGDPYWFELGRIIHEEVAEKVNPKRQKADGGFSYNQEPPFVNLIESKASKSYRTDGFPVDLIVHFDLRYGTASTTRGLCEKHRTLLETLITKGTFRRVWVFDELNKAVVWRLPEPS